MNDTKEFDQSNWKDRGAIYWDGKDWETHIFGGERQKFALGQMKYQILIKLPSGGVEEDVGCMSEAEDAQGSQGCPQPLSIPAKQVPHGPTDTITQMV